MKLEWNRFAAWWQADIYDRSTQSVFDNGATYRILSSTGNFELWVWSGPAEDSPVLGRVGFGPSLSKERAKRLTRYDSVEKAI